MVLVLAILFGIPPRTPGNLPKNLPAFLIFQCANPLVWIYSNQECDGYNNCGDCSDEAAIDMSQRLTREERIEIVLMSGERSNRVIAADFNARHPTRPPISHATVSKLLAKFRETGSVLDLPKCGRMKTVTNEETSVAVLASFSKSPQRSTRRMSLESGISRTSLRGY
ncbi:LRAD1 protein, partial [Polypterus senegalus]